MKHKLTNRLAECRAAKGISKSQLAYYLDLDRAAVTRLERGDIRPSIETAFRLAAYFKKPVDEIFQLVEGDDKINFLSVAGCGQEQQTMPGTTNPKRK
ncbi:MAG TPA: helix-turn-helix domain-containing protein [Candidatus Paceibacterota bacterium]|nr:helix-turn-helix domain-containing protein [Candidatus Paceibacterota bacterium]